VPSAGAAQAAAHHPEPLPEVWDGTPWLAFGTPGGDQQDQWSLLLLLPMAHHGMTLQQAIDAPAFHTTRAPATASSPDLNDPGAFHSCRHPMSSSGHS
jgi:gamma-glutamyltranspeptidase